MTLSYDVDNTSTGRLIPIIVAIVSIVLILIAITPNVPLEAIVFRGLSPAPPIIVTVMCIVLGLKVLKKLRGSSVCVELALVRGIDGQVLCSRIRDFARTLQAISKKCYVEYSVNSFEATLIIKCNSKDDVASAMERINSYTDIFSLRPCTSVEICVIHIPHTKYKEAVNKLLRLTGEKAIIVDIHGYVNTSALILKNIITAKKRARIIEEELKRHKDKDLIVLVDPTIDDILELTMRVRKLRREVKLIIMTDEPDILKLYRQCSIKLLR